MEERFVLYHPKHGYYVKDKKPNGAIEYTTDRAKAKVFTNLDEALQYRTNPSEMFVDV